MLVHLFLQAAAYYFHGLILDEGYEANSHAEALSCLKAAHAHLKESQRARTDFGNTEPFSQYAYSHFTPIAFLFVHQHVIFKSMQMPVYLPLAETLKYVTCYDVQSSLTLGSHELLRRENTERNIEQRTHFQRRLLQRNVSTLTKP